MADLVFNIRPASASRISAMDRHENDRTKDGSSAIEPGRSHLNKTLHGNSNGPLAALEELYASGVRKPSKQAESPYLQIVAGASPAYFRPGDPEARGTWDEARLRALQNRTLSWLRAEFGDDLVHASIHLDEDTPHIHALVAPTYERKKRVPGRRRKNEAEKDFLERRRAAQEAPGERTVGRASHPELSQPGSFKRLRESLSISVSDLGIDYGQDRLLGAPGNMTTREWVSREAVKLKKKSDNLDARQSELMEHERSWVNKLQEREAICNQRDRILDIAERDMDQREEHLDAREARLRQVYRKVQKMIGDVADSLGVGRTLREIGEVIKQGLLVGDPFSDMSLPKEPSEETLRPDL